jgi:hypothetical protein
MLGSRVSCADTACLSLALRAVLRHGLDAGSPPAGSTVPDAGATFGVLRPSWRSAFAGSAIPVCLCVPFANTTIIPFCSSPASACCRAGFLPLPLLRVLPGLRDEILAPYAFFVCRGGMPLPSLPHCAATVPLFLLMPHTARTCHPHTFDRFLPPGPGLRYLRVLLRKHQLFRGPTAVFSTTAHAAVQHTWTCSFAGAPCLVLSHLLPCGSAWFPAIRAVRVIPLLCDSTLYLFRHTFFCVTTRCFTAGCWHSAAWFLCGLPLLPAAVDSHPATFILRGSGSFTFVHGCAGSRDVLPATHALPLPRLCPATRCLPTYCAYL